MRALYQNANAPGVAQGVVGNRLFGDLVGEHCVRGRRALG